MASPVIGKPSRRASFALDLARGPEAGPSTWHRSTSTTTRARRCSTGICDRSEYYLTRRRARDPLRDHARSGVPSWAPASASWSSEVVAAPRPGRCSTRCRPRKYLAVDVNCWRLSTRPRPRFARSLPRALRVLSVRADFTLGAFELPAPSPRVRKTLVYFPGSTVGNLVPSEAIDLLLRVRAACGRGVRRGPRRRSQGRRRSACTRRTTVWAGLRAAFNKNPPHPSHNRELGTDFDVVRVRPLRVLRAGPWSDRDASRELEEAASRGSTPRALRLRARRIDSSPEYSAYKYTAPS